MSMSTNRKSFGRAVRPAIQSIMARHAKPAHKKTVEMLGFALALDTPDAWFAASALWQVHLTPQETAAMGWASLQATSTELAEPVARAVLDAAGPPLSPFNDPKSDANWWAELASDCERREYLLACFVRLSPADQIAFLAAISRRIAA